MKMHRFQTRMRSFDPALRTGRVNRIFATHIEADGPNLPLGAVCSIEALAGAQPFRAEVIKVDRDSVTLSSFDDGVPTFSGALVTADSDGHRVPVGDAFLGRAVDALGRPIDKAGPVRAEAFAALRGDALSPLDRRSPNDVLETGVRAIDGLLTLGIGQRIGLFAPSGAGKTTLLTQITQQAKADILVLCLVGERGREVEAIWHEALTQEARSKAVMVAATSDQSAAMRVRAGYYALALAEYWREQGRHVLFVLDSATRLAMAMREIGLAAGEPPTIRAYTPSVFAAIPRIVERCGALREGGAISAIMTVLSEGEDIDDPICELMKSILDGHILLSRTLAEQGHFPAIDLPRSISRQADTLAGETVRQKARRVQSWVSQYEGARTLIDAGLYGKGSNPELDQAIERRSAINGFLKQDRAERMTLKQTADQLARVVEAGV